MTLKTAKPVEVKSLYEFIVRPVGGKRYNNTKSIGGIDFIVSTSEEDHKYANREAEVLQVPLNYEGDIKVGDILLVHHNAFKFYNDIKGRRQSGKSFFKDDLFFIDNDQFFMYKQDGEWKSHDRYCFVSPIPPQDSYIFKPFTREPLVGVMEYPNKYLSAQGVKRGDTVIFKPESEYEFDVDGVIMYRMFDHQIVGVV